MEKMVVRDITFHSFHFLSLLKQRQEDQSTVWSQKAIEADGAHAFAHYLNHLASC